MRKIIMLIITIIMSTKLCYAIDIKINLSCNKTVVAPNSEVTCTVSGTSSSEISSFSGKVNLGSNLSLLNITTASIWQGDGSGGDIQLYTDNNKTGNFQIATIKVKVGGEYGTTTIGLQNVFVGDANFNEEGKTVSSVTIKVVSDNNYLKSLKLSNANLNFNKNTTSYNIELDAENTTISAETESQNATIKGDLGNKTLKYGKNTFKITVTSEAGTTKEYKIIVNRPNNNVVPPANNNNNENNEQEIKSNNNELKSILIGENIIDINDNAFEYNYEVEYDTDKVEILAEAVDEKAMITGIGTRDLSIGENTITITVTAENGDFRNYKLNINRKNKIEEEIKNPEIDCDTQEIQQPNKTISLLLITNFLLLIICLVLLYQKYKKNKLL